MSLTTTQRRILELLASGHSYEQVLVAYPESTYADIAEAIQSLIDGDLGDTTVPADRDWTPPNAYQPWTESADAELRGMALQGMPFGEIAERIGRTESAVKSRLVRVLLPDMIDTLR